MLLAKIGLGSDHRERRKSSLKKLNSSPMNEESAKLR